MINNLGLAIGTLDKEFYSYIHNFEKIKKAILTEVEILEIKKIKETYEKYRKEVIRSANATVTSRQIFFDDEFISFSIFSSYYPFILSLKLIVAPKEKIFSLLDLHNHKFLNNDFATIKIGFDYILQSYIIETHLFQYKFLWNYEKLIKEINKWIKLRVKAKNSINSSFNDVLKNNLTEEGKNIIYTGLSSIAVHEDKSKIPLVFTQTIDDKIRINCNTRQLAEFFKRLVNQHYNDNSPFPNTTIAHWIVSKFLVEKPGYIGFHEMKFISVYNTLKVKSKEPAKKNRILTDIIPYKK